MSQCGKFFHCAMTQIETVSVLIFCWNKDIGDKLSRCTAGGRQLLLLRWWQLATLCRQVHFLYHHPEWKQHYFLCLRGEDFCYLVPWYYPPSFPSPHRSLSKVECCWWGSPGPSRCRTRPCWWGSSRRASVSPQPLFFSDRKTQDHLRNWRGYIHRHKMQHSLGIWPHLYHWTWKLCLQLFGWRGEFERQRLNCRNHQVVAQDHICLRVPWDGKMNNRRRERLVTNDQSSNQSSNNCD